MVVCCQFYSYEIPNVKRNEDWGLSPYFKTEFKKKRLHQLYIWSTQYRLGTWNTMCGASLTKTSYVFYAFIVPPSPFPFTTLLSSNLVIWDNILFSICVFIFCLKKQLLFTFIRVKPSGTYKFHMTKLRLEGKIVWFLVCIVIHLYNYNMDSDQDGRPRGKIM